jgi:hypothetical protein
MGKVLIFNYVPFYGVFHRIPSFQDQAAGAILAVLPLLLFFEDAEGFAGEIWAPRT